MASQRLYWVVLIALLVVLAGCAPKVAPTPAPAPVAPTPAPPAALTPAPPSLSPEEAAWARVVEAARKEGMLTSYTFNLTGDPGRKVAQAFKDRYGIQIEYVGGVGSVLMERIKSERAAKRYIADVFDGATSFLASSVKEAGLTQSVGQLPSLKEEKVWRSYPRLDEEGHTIAWTWGLYTSFINTSLVRPGEEPKTYKELAEPKWKGKVVLGAPATTPSTTFPWVVRDRLELSEEWFRMLARNDTKFVATVRDSMQQMIIGDRAVTPFLSGATFGEFIARGAPVRAVAMEEGAVAVMGGGISIVMDAPHPNAARVFINWLLSAEGQQVYGGAANTTPVRADVKDFLPPAAQIEPKRVVPMNVADLIEAGKVQRERTLDKVFGLE